MAELNFHHLYLFLTVARTGNFSRAAERLYLRQPSVSAQVRELERSLGLPLVERSGRRFRLTEAGRRVYAYAEQIFGLADALARELEDLKGLRVGNLRVGASTTVGEYVLPQALRLFQQRYPGIEVRAVIDNTANIAGSVARGELRLGLVGDRPDQPGLESRPFMQDTIVLFAARDHPLAKQRVLPQDLHAVPMVMREPGSATRQTAEAALAHAQAKPTVAVEVGSNEAVKRAVVAGIGIGALSRLALDAELATGTLSLLDAPWFEARRALYVIRRGDAYLSPADRAFVSLIRELSGQAGSEPT